MKREDETILKALPPFQMYIKKGVESVYFSYETVYTVERGTYSKRIFLKRLP